MSLHFGPPLVVGPFPRICRVEIFPRYYDTARLYPRWRCGEEMDIERKDITIVQHDDTGFFFFPLDSESNPLDISGFQSFTWVISDDVTGIVHLTKTTSDNTILKPSAFTLSISLSKSDTGGLPVTTKFPEIKNSKNSLYHELKGLNSAGQQQTMLRGKVYVEDTRINDT